MSVGGEITVQGEDAVELFASALAAAEDDDLDWEISEEAVKALAEKYKGEEYPLFMDELPRDANDNPHIAALHELVYGDDTTAELRAENFRELGNECLEDSSVNKRRFNDALKYYTLGLEQNAADAKLNSVLYSNICHVYLMKKQFVDCVDSSRKAVDLDPCNVKAYFRGAKASFYMGLFNQAACFCRRGLKHSPENKTISGLLKLCEEKIEKIESRRRIEAKESISVNTIDRLLEQRGIGIVPNSYDGLLQRADDMKPKLSPGISGDDDIIHWPVLLLFDEVRVSEVILDFSEDTTLEDHLKVVLPGDRHADWDTAMQYSWDAVSAFLDVSNADESVYIVNQRLSLRRLLEATRRVAGFPVFHILREGSEAESNFHSEFKVMPLKIVNAKE